MSADLTECDATCIAIIDTLSNASTSELIPGATVLNDLFEHALTIIERTLPFENREYSNGEFRNSKQIRLAFRDRFVDSYPSFTKAQKEKALTTLFNIINNAEQTYVYPHIQLSLSMLGKLWGKFGQASYIFDDSLRAEDENSPKVLTWRLLEQTILEHPNRRVREAAIWTVYTIRKTDQCWAENLEQWFIDLLTPIFEQEAENTTLYKLAEMVLYQVGEIEDDYAFDEQDDDA